MENQYSGIIPGIRPSLNTAVFLRRKLRAWLISRSGVSQGVFDPLAGEVCFSLADQVVHYTRVLRRAREKRTKTRQGPLDLKRFWPNLQSVKPEDFDRWPCSFESSSEMNAFPSKTVGLASDEWGRQFLDGPPPPL